MTHIPRYENECDKGDVNANAKSDRSAEYAHMVGQKNVDATAMNDNAEYEYSGTSRATDRPHAYRPRIAGVKCERVRVIIYNILVLL